MLKSVEKFSQELKHADLPDMTMELLQPMFPDRFKQVQEQEVLQELKWTCEEELSVLVLRETLS